MQHYSPGRLSSRTARDGEKETEREWFYSWVCCLTILQAMVTNDS